METSEHHEHPEHGPKNKQASIAGSIILAALIISGSLFYNNKVLVESLSNQQLTGTTVNAPAAAVVPPAAPTGPVAVKDRSDQPTLGSKDAKVTMVEFADFQCPFCKSYFQQTFPELKSKYIDTGKVKLVFRHFPLTQIHVNAQIASVGAECANRQGKFWPYHDLLYTNSQSNGTGLDKASLEKYADQLGLNNGTLGFGKNKFNQCLESNATLDIVNKDQAEGAKDGVTGTPSFFINGKQLVGAQPATAFEQAIEAALKQ